MKKNVIIIAVFIVLLCTAGRFILMRSTENDFEKTDYEKIDLTGIEKLMIIAHPDDDILWGGSELINEDYLVVCITCGSDARRVGEFESVMESTNDKYVMLGYPDKTNGKRDNWDTVRGDIMADIEKIYALKNWNMVLTHNPEGEYGHIHHKMTDVIVTDIVDHNNLYYFGKYYSKKDLEEKDIDLPLIDEQTLEKKKELLNLYVSQDKTIHETFGHMIASEDVISYKEWNEKYGQE